MGRDKAWLEWNGRPLLAWAVDKAHAIGIDEVFISGRPGVDYSAFDYPVLLDREPHLGPLSGIERGLDACASPLLLVLAVDLPRLTTAWLRRLVAGCDSLTGVVPRLHGELEPLVAIYPKRCHVFALEGVLHGRRAVQDFARACLRERAVRILRMPNSAATAFANCNHPADLERAES